MSTLRTLRQLRACATLLAAAAYLAAVPAALRAQGTCDVNNQATCTAGGDAAHAITVTITVAARLTAPATTIALPGPSTASFQSGFGAALSVPLSVWSNTGWTVALSAIDPLWGATPGSAWQAKPAGDLQWALGSGGPYTAVTTTPTTIQSGTAVAAGTVPLHLRVSYQWTQDAPGSYELPLRLTITAP